MPCFAAMLRKLATLSFRSVIIGLLVYAPIFSQDEASVEKEPVKLTVKKGKATFKNLTYPVFTGVAKAQPCQREDCVQYDIESPSVEKSLKIAKKIRVFYKGKKIKGIKLGKFQKYGAGRNAWYASGEKGKERVGVIVIAPDFGVRVYVASDFDDNMLLLY